MKILVACEYSGVVRDAFIKRGHDAMSCDLLPTDQPGPHYQGSVLDVLDDGWDMMIAHPPCTFLTNSGSRWLYREANHKNPVATPQEMETLAEVVKMFPSARPFPSNLSGIAARRWSDMLAGSAFFKTLLDADIPKIAVENPTMHGYAKEMMG